MTRPKERTMITVHLTREGGGVWTVSLRTPTADFPVTTTDYEEAHAEANRLALLADDGRADLIIASLVD